MSAISNIYCPKCGRSIDQSTRDESTRKCDFCGAGFEWMVEWMMEERRLGVEYLRYFSAAILGGILLSIAVLMLAGMLTQFNAVLIPVWFALGAIAGILWLVSERMDQYSSSDNEEHKPKS